MPARLCYIADTSASHYSYDLARSHVNLRQAHTLIQKLGILKLPSLIHSAQQLAATDWKTRPLYTDADFILLLLLL